MTSSVSRVYKFLLLLALGTMALATPGGGSDDSSLKSVLAGPGLTGGGSGKTVTLAIANGGVTTQMLAPATVTALQGAQGPIGPQGPAGPQGPPGGGSSGYKAFYIDSATMTSTTFDLTPYGSTAQDQNGNSVVVVPSRQSTISFDVAQPSVVRISRVEFANGPSTVDGYTYTNFGENIQLLDANMVPVAVQGQLGQSTSNADFFFANNLLKIEPGHYTLVTNIAALSTFTYTYADNTYHPEPLDLSFLTAGGTVELVPISAS